MVSHCSQLLIPSHILRTHFLDLGYKNYRMDNGQEEEKEIYDELDYPLHEGDTWSAILGSFYH